MDKERALELYKIFRQESSTPLTFLHETVRRYLTLITAIFAASFAAASTAVTQFGDDRGRVILAAVGIFGPGLNIVLCWLAVESSERSYQSFLEIVTVMAKLEVLIGLVGERPKGATRDTSLPFPDDENIVPDRWLEYHNYSTAQEFVEDHMNKGSGRMVQRIFRLLGIASILLFLSAEVASFLGWSHTN